MPTPGTEEATTENQYRKNLELCCRPDEARRCEWFFNWSDPKAPNISYAVGDTLCGHRWIDQLFCCKPGDKDSGSHCYQIRVEILKLNNHLLTAKKALMIWAIYRKELAEAMKSNDENRAKDCKDILEALLQDDEELRIGEVKAIYKKYFDEKSGNSEEEGWKQIKEYLEGTEEKQKCDGNFAGEIAKILRSKLKQVQAERYPGETSPIWFQTLQVMDVCSEYCDNIEVSPSVWEKLTGKYGEKYRLRIS